jgi:hypothetical protein
MDEFGLDRPEFTGALISMEFGEGGRIHQLWASDPNLPEEGEDFQFVLSPVRFGEEFSEDYFPGTILIGARQNPEEPWILSRNEHAEQLDTFDEDYSAITFAYEFGLLPEIDACGRFYEIGGTIPQAVWDVTLTNRGRVSIEIGELAFPFAFNNLYEGFGRSDKGAKGLWQDRVHVHKCIAGAGSYLFAQRLNAEPPGLLVFPGDGTEWEFYNHVPASLNTPFRWQGIPVVYVHSRAAIEREGWSDWVNDHTSLILEPGDARTFQTRFVPSERDRFDTLSQTLAACGRPAVRLLPGGVAPKDVGIAIEIGGATPARFFMSSQSKIETESDEDGGFCFVRPGHAGPLRIGFEDTQGRKTYCHLQFTEPIEDLIRARAKWILDYQTHHEPGSALHRAILMANTRTGQRLTDPEEYAGPFGVEGSLSDALFLAEKNTIYPERSEIAVLDDFICEFLRDDLQNPADDTVGSAFADTRSVALNFARANVYPLVFNLYHAMYRVARLYGDTAMQPKEYLHHAFGTCLAMLKHGIPRQTRGVGLPGFSRVYEVLSDLAAEDMNLEIDRLLPYLTGRAEDLLRREYPYTSDSSWDTAGFAEVFTAARHLNDDVQQERAMRCAYAARSLAPSWWWYGSDTRQWDDAEVPPLPMMNDRGELCQGYSTVENSLMFFETLDRDYGQIPEAYMRLAFGGLLGVWGLIRPDGSASMAYCPDLASKQYGFSPITGDIGLALFHYLRGAGAYVLPSRTYGVFTFGCHFEIVDDAYIVRPWDGIGRKIIMRQVGAEFGLSFGKLREIRLDVRKRWTRVEIENPADKELRTELRIRGLWGKHFEIMGERVEASDGELAVSLPLLTRGVSVFDLKVIE